MAKRDDKENQPTRRVYKSSDVHRRRVGDATRSKPAKMPSKREARESARESTRIAAESRAGKAGRTEPAVDGETSQAATTEAPRREEKRPQFTVIRSKAADREGEARPDRQAETSPDRRSGRREEPSRSAETEQRPRPTLAPARLRRPAQDDGEGGSIEAEPDQTTKQPRRRAIADAADKLPRLRPRTIAIAVVMVVAIIAVSVFAFNRWGRYDDHADLQGTWYVLGTEVPIEIDAETIRFNDEVSYAYQIDAREKTISYTFGPMSGQGRYWFSDDRKHLVITDGDGYTAAGTTVDDLVHAFLDFSTSTGGGIVELPQGEGIIAFSRTPEVVAVNQPAEELVAAPSGEAPADEQATADQAAADQAAADQATEGAPTDDQATEDQPAEEQLDEYQPSESGTTEETTDGEEPA